jgi:NAD(P)-dependent dehydrogenase (short-subunit alcohol dehydrogenase family)
MKDKVVLITGANTGIGKAAALELARQGATVVITARNEVKAKAAQADIIEKTGNSRVSILLADFGDFAQVRQMAEEFKSRHDRLDVLINNAGLILDERRESVDGNEMTMQVNHLSPYLLTHLLLDVLKASAPARIVNVASDAHRSASSGFAKSMNELQALGKYTSFNVYGQSKLANILFSRKLARELEGSGVTVNSLHPGVVNTGFAADGDVKGFFSFVINLIRPFLLTPEKGARTTVYLASSPEVEGVSGKYFDKCKAKKPKPWAEDDEAAERLWKWSRELTGEG